MLKVAVVRFPGSNCDFDTLRAAERVGAESFFVWHRDTSLQGADVVLLPGGFSYGDYLRSGAIARFSPVMQAVQNFAANGGLVLGICNGFQILCEAGLLPGALIRNRSLQFRCETVHLRAENADTAFTNQIPAGKLLRVPIAHGEGCYFADPVTLAQLNERKQVLWRYVNSKGEPTDAANPNGSVENIAGICNQQGNVAGLMPHPERASESLLGSADGRLIFESVAHWLTQGAVAKVA